MATGLLVGAMGVPSARADEGESALGLWSDPHASATWGHLVSSQLDSEEPTAFWSMALDLPLSRGHGLSTQLRFDSIVFGDSDRLFSRLVHPGRTDYSIGVRWIPSGWLGVEAHHVSSHEVSILHDGQDIDFEEGTDRGGASNFVSLLMRTRAVELRAGVGGQWTDTNTAPILMDVEGVLLNSRRAAGPFVAVRYPLLRAEHPRSMRAVLNAFYVFDRQRLSMSRSESSYLAWALNVDQPLHRRVHFGLAYVGNNGTPGIKRANNALNLYITLRWRIED